MYGIVGFVNAGLELATQVESGRLPEPDIIYVACGTLGTAASLVLGLRAAQLKTRVVAVKVVTSPRVSEGRLLRRVQATNTLLHTLDASLPLFEFTGSEFEASEGYCGARYALFTSEGMAAPRVVEQMEGLRLDGTYTGKTFAAIIDDARSRRICRKRVLFWNTLNS